MLGGIFIHIYQSTIGEPGTFQAMIRGAVSEAWAWTFHPAWYKQVTGRDPVQACEEARRKMEPGGKLPIGRAGVARICKLNGPSKSERGIDITAGGGDCRLRLPALAGQLC